MKSSIIAAVSAVSLAAAALKNSKPRETQAPSEETTNKLRMDLVDLNEASKEELVELDGIEPRVAEQIIKMRPYRDHAEASRKLGESFQLPRWLAKAA